MRRTDCYARRWNRPSTGMTSFCWTVRPRWAYLALEGLARLMNTLDRIRATSNPRLRIFGLVMTMYDGRTTLSQQVAEEVRRHYPTLIFNAVIPRSVRLSEAPSFGTPILQYDPQSRGALAYRELAQEVASRAAPFHSL